MSQPPPINLPPLSGPTQEECDFFLGEYMRAWGFVEMAVSVLIRKLVEADITTVQIILRALPDMRSQRELASELGRHRLHKADIDTLERLLGRLKTAATRRNRIVHGYWILHLEMGPIPNPQPLTAKSRKLMRIYEPAQQDEMRKLMEGKSQKLNAAYTFWPDQIRKDAKIAAALADDLHKFTESVRLRPPVIPLPVEW